MENNTALKNPTATFVGLAIALFGAPVFVALYRAITGENHSDAQVLGRELGIFLLVGLLLWIVKRWELLPLTSIGLQVDRLRTSLLRGLGLAVIVLIVTVGLYLLLRGVGFHLGEDHANAFHPSLLIVTLITLRAGIAEEIFYRGLEAAAPRGQQMGGRAVAARAIRAGALPPGSGRHHRGIRPGWNSYRVLYEVSRSSGEYDRAFSRRFCAQRAPTLRSGG